MWAWKRIEGDDLGLEQRPLVSAAIDERIGGVGLDRLSITRHAGELRRPLGQLRLVQDVTGPMPVADHRTEKHDPRQLRRIPLGEPGAQQPTHRMADHHHRQSGVLADRDVDQRPEIVDDVLEVGDQRPLAVAVAVAEVILAVHDRAGGGESVGHMAVTTGVFRVAVHDHHDPGR